MTNESAGKAVIVGLGKSGVSTARHLAARGWRLAVTDSREAPPGREAIATIDATAECRFGRFDAALLEGADIVVASPGVSLREPLFERAVTQGIEVVGDIELFARAARAPVVGITGTNGKSTVTTLVGRMAARAGRRVAVGGNLGTPALDLLGEPEPELYVLEISSFQLDTTRSLRTLAATVLNVSADHLDRYGDLAHYAASKARIFDGCELGVLNFDDAQVRAMPSEHRPERFCGFSITGAAGADYALLQHEGEPWLAVRGMPVLPVAAMRVAGLHNAANALAALALGEACGLPLAVMIDELREFTGLPHRSQWVGEYRGVRYINDSKGTNVGATIAAVEGMSASLLLIAGGDGKGQDFAPLATAVAGRVRLALLIGRDAPQLEQALVGSCAVRRCESLEEAVREAAGSALPGEIVLLSPACASLDMFRDYTERGERFAAAVRRLSS